MEITKLIYGDLVLDVNISGLNDLFIHVNDNIEGDEDGIYQPPTHFLTDEHTNLFPYNHFVFHSCFTKGRITEEELEKMLFHKMIDYQTILN